MGFKGKEKIKKERGKKREREKKRMACYKKTGGSTYNDCLGVELVLGQKKLVSPKWELQWI
jgi:hypothetical protein